MARNKLVISDLQAPYHHPDTLPFLTAVKMKFNPDEIYNIGDLADFHGLNFHGVNPNLPSAREELILLRAFVRNLAKLFPRMIIVDSNHDALPKRKAKSIGLPDEMIRDIGSIMGAPKTWKFVKRVILKLNNGMLCQIRHNLSANAVKNMLSQGISGIFGHFHTKAGSTWSRDIFFQHKFAVQVGCLINESSEAFGYADTFADLPVLTAVVLIDGSYPLHIPMLCNKKGRWIGKI